MLNSPSTRAINTSTVQNDYSGLQISSPINPQLNQANNHQTLSTNSNQSQYSLQVTKAPAQQYQNYPQP